MVEDKPKKAVEITSMPSKADKRAEALRENLRKRKELAKSKKDNS